MEGDNSLGDGVEEDGPEEVSELLSSRRTTVDLQNVLEDMAYNSQAPDAMFLSAEGSNGLVQRKKERSAVLYQLNF